MHAVLLFALACSAHLVSAQDQPDAIFRINDIERVVAIADIHGAYEPFVSLLQGTLLADERLHWTGQQTHLVIVGDVLDRGDRSREVLDLLMRLEQEALAAGGAVHMVLGNHEVMNLSGELGYVTREEFSAYADLEQNSMRRPAQARFSERVPGLSALALRSAFGRDYPRGFFGHRAAFAPDGVYGRWLLDKPVLLVINDIAFVHAGMSAAMAGQSVDEINTSVTNTLRRYVDAMQVLMNAEVLFPETDFNTHVALVRRYLDNGRQRNDPAIRAAAQTLLDAAERAPFSSDSPVWYRGMVACSPILEQARLHALQASLDVERLVIGHTPTADHHVQHRFDQALLMADTGMLNEYYGGQPAAVIFENDGASVYYADTAATSEPLPMPRLVGERPFNVDDDALAELLASADITASTDLPDGTRELSLRAGQTAFTAVFKPANGAFVPQVATYRIDRLLGIDMVPVAVRRVIDGQAGAVYLKPEAGEGQLAQSASDTPWCPAADQQALGALFDYLINQQNRPAADRFYMTSNGKLVLGHRSDGNILSASTSSALPGPDALALAAIVENGLAALTRAQLDATLGDVLDVPRRDALLTRRDRLLDNSRN